MTPSFAHIRALRALAREGYDEAAHELAQIEASLAVDSDRARLGFPMRSPTHRPKHSQFRTGRSDVRLTAR